MGSRESRRTISEISARIADVLTTRTTVSSVRAGTPDHAYGAGAEEAALVGVLIAAFAIPARAAPRHGRSAGPGTACTGAITVKST